MPKAQDRHNAPRIEMCEVLVDAMREALKVGAFRDFYRLVAPTLAQIGIDAPAEIVDSGSTIGEALIRVACDEQTRFLDRMGIVREYQRERWARWNAKREAEANAQQTVSQPLANAQQTVSQHVTGTETASATDSASATVPDTETASVPKSRDGRAGARNAREAVDADFERFWSAYGKRGVRKTAEAAFAKARKSKTWPGIDAICLSLAIWRASNAWTKDNGQYQPHASTWLNQERWNDEPPPDATAYAETHEAAPTFDSAAALQKHGGDQ